MNLDDRNYAEFKVSDLFTVKYGVNLELTTCMECDKSEILSVNFVARTAENNGVSSCVQIIDNIEPQKAGLISVAAGGSVLSTFLQNEPFYSGRDLYTLEAKDNISDEAKMFVITIIEKNKYKYNYGRQANKTLPDLLLKLPVNNENKPDWQFMEDYIKSLHYKPLTTKNKTGQAPDLNVSEWKEFALTDIFTSLDTGKISNASDLDMGDDLPYLGAKKDNNGVMQMCIDIPNKRSKGNCVVMICDGEGSVGLANYMDSDFLGTVNLMLGYNEKYLNAYTGLFLATVLCQERPKYSFGRKWKTHIPETIIKLPVNSDGNPDWQFMENYIKALPYGDRLQG